MASFTKQFSLFLLITLLLSSLKIHARDSQYFNKVTSTNGNTKQPLNNPQTEQPQTEQPLNNPQTEQQQQPNFIPDNENGYGLYGHESGQFPPATTTAANTESEQPLNRHLPKNYNPVAYVTEPEDSTTLGEEKSFATNPTNYYNGEQNNYNGQQGEEESSEYRSYPTSANTNNRENYYYNGGSSFNSQPQESSNTRFRDDATLSNFNNQPQGLSDTRFTGGATLSNRDNYFNNRGNANGFQPQGMSDTRHLENGKYFYDIKTDKYSTNHPYESLRGVRPTNDQFTNRNYYENSENSYEFNNENSMGEFQNEQNNNLP